MNKLMTTLALGILATSATDADARRGGGTVPVNDSIKPTLIVTMNDTTNAGPIIWYEHNVMPPRVHWKYNYVGPQALGCRGTVSDGWAEYWTDTFNQTDFTDKYIQKRTYFFRELAGPNMPIGTVPYSFTVRAEDLSGIKRIEVSLPERDVAWVGQWQNPLVLEDGPTEFVNVSQGDAVADFVEIRGANGDMQGWRKTLTYERPNPAFAAANQVVDLTFAVTHLGNAATLNVEVEDHAGNVRTGSVYLAMNDMCLN